MVGTLKDILDLLLEKGPQYVLPLAIIGLSIYQKFSDNKIMKRQHDTIENQNKTITNIVDHGQIPHELIAGIQSIQRAQTATLSTQQRLSKELIGITHLIADVEEK